jgi:hypothetical protein
MAPAPPKLINAFPLNMSDSAVANGITITPISNGKASKYRTVPYNCKPNSHIEEDQKILTVSI